MAKIRVLVVDDAVVVRRLLADALAGDPALEVAGTAANGRIALSKIDRSKPDLVVLDVEMPEMDGLATLAELRRTHARLPVIMYSAHTERGATATLDALALGANDYVTKPAHSAGVDVAIQRIREELIPKIKALCCKVGAHTKPTSAAVPPSRPAVAAVSRPAQRVDIVAIGVSTGGPNALAQLIPALPADFPVPVVIVQHMPPIFTQSLAGRLTACAKIAVNEGAAGAVLRPGGAWIAPGDYHMVLQRRIVAVQLQTHQAAPENSCRPAVDVLFRSVAEVYGAHALALVLTGMGQDGLRGCEAIHAAGGQVIVQDESSSVVWGMPGSIAAAGLADQVLPLDRLAGEIVRRVRFGRL